MRSAVLMIAAAVLGLGGCAPSVDVAAEKASVRTVVNQFHQVWETEDIGLLSRIMAHDPEMVCFGSDVTEHFVGWENLKEAVEAMFPAFENVTLTVRDQTVEVHDSGEVAWFSEFLRWDLTMGGQPMTMDGFRLTGVLVKRGGSWVIEQFHGSMPVLVEGAE